MDKHLFLMVFAFFCIDVIVLTLWQIIDPMYLEVVDIHEHVSSHYTKNINLPCLHDPPRT